MRRTTVVAAAVGLAACSALTDDNPVASIQLSFNDSAVAVGDALSLEAHALDAAGLETGKTVTWTSSNPSVAIVIVGSIAGVAPGTATITATVDGISSSATLAVFQPIYEAVAAGEYFSCGLMTTGTVRCWGELQTQQPMPPTDMAGTYTAITAGTYHACGLRSGGKAYCWGSSLLTPYAATPTLVPGPQQFTSIAAGGRRTCGLTAAGTAWCWGSDGPLGDGSDTASTTPVLVLGSLAFRSLVGGGMHLCGITTSAAMYCWGDNWHGAIGNGTSGVANPVLSPTVVSPGVSFRGAAATYFGTCGLRGSGVPWCWGDCGPSVVSLTPQLVPNGGTFESIVGGKSAVCGLRNGRAYCFGVNVNGLFGNGTETASSAPTIAAGGMSLRQIAVGSFHACGVSSRGIAYCWGWNLQSQLGDGSITQRLDPVRVLDQ